MLHGKAGGAEECSAAHGIIKRNLMCLVSLFRSQMHYTSRVFKDTTSIGKAPLCHSSDLSKGRCSRRRSIEVRRKDVYNSGICQVCFVRSQILALVVPVYLQLSLSSLLFPLLTILDFG